MQEPLIAPAGDTLDFLPAVGETARRVRALDWARTPLGPPDAWPPSLRTAAGLCLAWSAPACIAWGPTRTLIHNDACAPILGDQSALALGRDFAESALAAEPAIADGIRRAWHGEAVCLADQAIRIGAGDRVEQRLYTFALTPMRDETGAVAGVFLALTDVTRHALPERAEVPRSAQIETSLREANRRLSAVLDSVSDVFLAVDRDWRIAGINDRALQFSGRRREDVLGCEVWATFPMYRGTELETALRQAMRKRQPFRHEYLGKLSARWFEISVYPSADGLSVFGRDIDERKRAEQRLRDSEERFRQMADAMPQIVWTAAPDGRITFINRQWELYTGLTLEQTNRADAVARVLHPDDLPRALERWNASLARGEPHEVQWRFRRHADGAYRWFLTRAVPVRDDSGAIREWFGTATDMHEQKLVEERLRRSEQRFVRFMEHMPGLVWLKDLSGRFVYLNDASAKAWGVTRDELLGKRAENLLSPDTDAQCRESDALAARTPEGIQVLESYLNADGEQRYVLVSKFPTPDGADGGALIGGIAIDVTERRHAQEALGRERELLQKIFDTIPVMITMYEPDVRVLRLNRACERILGWSTADTARISIMEECYPDPAYRAQVQEFMESCREGWMDLRMRTRDGRDIETSWANIRLSDHTRIGIGIDISERRRAEAALRESDERLRLTLRGASAGAWRFDLATGETFWSEEFDALYGADAAAHPSYETWLARVHPDDRERVRAAFFVKLKSKETEFQHEFRVQHPQRGMRWILDLGRIERDAAGRATGFSGINLDITERKLAEERLRASEERFRHLSESGLISIAFFRTTGEIVEANDAFLDMVGYSREELGAGKVRWDRLTPPEWMPRTLHALEEFHATGRVTPYEKEYFRRDGRRFWGLFGGARLGDSGEGVAFVIDITERRRAEQALRDSERLYRAIGESIDYGVWVCDPEGRNVYASESFLRLVGQTQEECAAFGWGKVLHPEDAERTVAAWRECVRTGGQWDIEHRYRGVDGRWHPILARGVPVRNERGEITAWAGINLDISRIKRVEKELRDADRRKDEFLAILAHELRNPLAPLRNGLEIMRLARENREALEQARGMMERQLTHLVRLVDDLLDLSRITRGRVELHRERVDLAVVVRHALDTSRPLIEQAAHELSVRLPSEPVMVEADTIRLAQAIANLLNNAAKYTDRGGYIRLAVECRESTVDISVQDNGVGIPPALLPHVFDMFSRVERPLGKVHGGLGIGLSIVKHLIEMHGGTVEARSPGDGGGSEFRIRLPRLARPDGFRGSTPANGARRDRSAARRVLVADDNPDAVASLATLLELLGNDVRTARDGWEAVEVAAWFRPELALLDIGMPGLDGCGACRRIREQPGAQQMTIVALTGWGQEEDKRRSQAAGFDQHLVKPVEPAVLERLLATLVS